MQERTPNLFCILAVSALLELSAPAQFVASPAFSGKPGAIPIKVSGRFGLVLIHAQVNGETATLIVDTGCSNTILSTRFASSAPEPAPLPSKGSGWVGRATRIHATLKIGATVWPNHEFLAMDDLGDISRALTSPVDGVLGQDILRQFRTVAIDFKRRRLILSR